MYIFCISGALALLIQRVNPTRTHHPKSVRINLLPKTKIIMQFYRVKAYLDISK